MPSLARMCSRPNGFVGDASIFLSYSHCGNDESGKRVVRIVEEAGSWFDRNIIGPRRSPDVTRDDRAARLDMLDDQFRQRPNQSIQTIRRIPSTAAIEVAGKAAQL